MGKKNLPAIIAENEILKKIRENQPLTAYQLFKMTHYLSYTSVHNYLNILEARGKIKSRFGISPNRKAVRIIETVDDDKK